MYVRTTGGGWRGPDAFKSFSDLTMTRNLESQPKHRSGVRGASGRPRAVGRLPAAFRDCDLPKSNVHRFITPKSRDARVRGVGDSENVLREPRLLQYIDSKYKRAYIKQCINVVRTLRVLVAEFWTRLNGRRCSQQQHTLQGLPITVTDQYNTHVHR